MTIFYRSASHSEYKREVIEPACEAWGMDRSDPRFPTIVKMMAELCDGGGWSPDEVLRMLISLGASTG